LVTDPTAWSADLRITPDGEGIVAWAGAVPVRMLADRTGCGWTAWHRFTVLSMIALAILIIAAAHHQPIRSS
jgi:hypothetical protein